MSDTFVCSVCRQEYEKVWSDEEALTELKEKFPGFEPEECSLVCEDCYQKLVK